MDHGAEFRTKYGQVFHNVTSLCWPKHHHQVKEAQGNKGLQVISLRACLYEEKHLTCQTRGWEVRFHLPIESFVYIFILRSHDERNTTGIVKSHLTRSGISPGWSAIFPYKRNTSGKVRRIEIICWFLLVSPFWFHGRETLLHLAFQPRGWQVRWKISYKTVAEIYLASQPRVWQVRCFSSYKQGLSLSPIWLAAINSELNTTDPYHQQPFNCPILGIVIISQSDAWTTAFK